MASSGLLQKVPPSALPGQPGFGWRAQDYRHPLTGQVSKDQFALYCSKDGGLSGVNSPPFPVQTIQPDAVR